MSSGCRSTRRRNCSPASATARLRRDLVISAGPGDSRPAGSIVLGRVVHSAAGLDSAFVAIGDARPGILPLREAAADGVTLDEGARVIVAVRREALPGKGA